MKADEFDETVQRLDLKLKSLQGRIDQLNTHFDLERDGDDFFDHVQEADFAKFHGTKDKAILSERISPKMLESISRLPNPLEGGQAILSEKLLGFESQRAYLESLNLREVCYQTFETLQESIHKIQKHFDPSEPLLGTDIGTYQLLHDITRQRNFLNIFNQNFRRVVNHIIELSSYLSAKEENYVEQINSLSR